MKTIGVLHNSLNSCGGGERVCISIIEALKEMGFKVVLATVEPTDWHRVDNIFGEIEKPDKELSLVKFKVRSFGIYLRQLSFLLAAKLRKECDLIINTHGDVIPIATDIVYVHYPTFALLEEEPNLIAANIKYSKSLFWKMYFAPYKLLASVNAYLFSGKSKLLLTNSEFSKKAIERFLGQKAVVLHPPVDVDRFYWPFGGREDIIVSCGRYSPEKNYEFVLRLAEVLNEFQFMIIGASSGNVSDRYYRKLLTIVKNKKIKNVDLIRDLPFDQLVRTYRKAKVYLHAMRGEHFGIAVAEAMASGLIPVVHKSGGAWTDIVDYGAYGYGYSSFEEAVNAVEKAVMKADELRGSIIKQAMNFNKSNFKKRFKQILENILSF